MAMISESLSLELHLTPVKPEITSFFWLQGVGGVSEAFFSDEGEAIMPTYLAAVIANDYKNMCSGFSFLGVSCK